MSLKNPSAFFALLRGRKVLGDLDQSEVNGLNDLVAAFSAAKWPVSWAAYGLATAFHETGGKMQPVKELGGHAYYTRMYDIRGARPKKAIELGNTNPGDGAKYPGRGYDQCTGKANYAKAGKVVGYDLVADPDRLLRDPVMAARIMVHGMVTGRYTGRKISDDLPRTGRASFEQFVRTRDVINGHDRERDIAHEALDFQDALVAGGYA